MATMNTNLPTIDELVYQFASPVFSAKQLRKEFQPSAIRRLIEGAYRGEALKTHIGCGGGKTTIFMLAALHLLMKGQFKRLVFVAPTIVLTRQLEIEFCEMLEAMYRESRARPKQAFPVINVSSDRKVEDDGDDEEDEKEAQGQRETFDNIVRLTESRGDKLVELLQHHKLAAYFVCKPSFFDNFRHQVVKADVVMDVTVFDEYHNLINQRKEENLLRPLREWEQHCRNRWFFSATKRYGAVMSCNDMIFGDEVCDVESHQLVGWGYLVPHLRTTFMHAGSVSGISDALEKHFKDAGIKKGADFYREAAALIAVIREMVRRKVVPQAIMFGSKVAILKQLMKIDAFKQVLEESCPGIKLYGIFGDTPREVRNQIFDEIRSAPDNQPFVLLNHSVIKEGVNVTRFNCLLLARGMSSCGLQQAVGRVQRTYPGKDTAHVFIHIHGDDGDVIKQRAAGVLEYLHYAIGDAPCDFSDLVDERSGEVKDQVQDFRNITDLEVPLLLTDVQLVDWASSERQRLQESGQLSSRLELLSKIPTAKKLMMVGAF